MKRQAVLVLGMHRGGTSLAAGLLVHLGLQGPSTLMQPGRDNPGGYWESVPFFEFHDRLLDSATTSWDGWTPVNADGNSDRAETDAAEFQALLEQEFESSPLFVVKDPRICRLVPCWTRGLREAGVEPLVLLTLRSPAEVALSLAARDGFAREHALLLWLRHMLDAEHDTRTIRRAAVRYEDLLADWRGEMDRIGVELGLEWPIGASRAKATIDDFVRPDLRHHSACVEAIASIGAPLADWVLGAAEALDALVGPGPADGVFRRLDEIRGQLDRAAAQFGGWQDAEQQARRQRAAALDAERAGWQQRTADLENANRHLTHELAVARRRRDAVLASLSWRITAPLRALARPFFRTGPDKPGPPED